MEANRNHFKIALLWGGGLGDLLVLNPLVNALKSNKKCEIYFLTTASHLPGLAKEILGDIHIMKLSQNPVSIVTFINQYNRFFDIVYLGPYPTMKTSLLGSVLFPGTVWSRQHKKISPYILEQILADITCLDLPASDSKDFSKLLPWSIDHGEQLGNDLSPFLTLHPGSKEKWQTTRWHRENWRQLVRIIVSETDMNLILIGIESERGLIDQITHGLPDHTKSRVTHAIGWQLNRITSIISRSKGVVCHNSGILHLSTMLKKKTIAITGSSAKFWQPQYPWIKNISSGKCNLACNSYRCPVPFFKAKCIRKLRVEKVMKAIHSHLLQ